MEHKIWGEQIKHVQQTLDKINARRAINMLRRSVEEIAAESLFHEPDIEHLSEGFDTAVQNLIDRKSIVSGYTVVQKVVGRCRTTAYRNYVLLVWNTLDSKGVSGTAQKVVHLSIRRAKQLFRRKIQNSILCDTFVKPVAPVSSIQLNMVITREGANFSEVSNG